MKKLICALLFAPCLATSAQSTDASTTYYLPKTALRFQIQLEKTSYKPGILAGYAMIYLKKPDVVQDAYTHYRIIGITMDSYGVPDTSKAHTLIIDKKHDISKVSLSPDGVLLGINADGRVPAAPKPFVEHKHSFPPDAQQYMSEDILRAGSYAKMAELTAQEIYDIRDSRSSLAKGQADFMPKDGTQLKLMLQNLDKQEKGLMSAFTGNTVTDTVQYTVTYVPTRAVSNEVLFRLSAWDGVTSTSDLSGAPYYISIEPLHQFKSTAQPADKKEKSVLDLWVNQPDKIQVTLSDGTQTVAHFQTLAGQFGEEERLSDELFNKKQSSSVVLDAVSGGIEKITRLPGEK